MEGEESEIDFGTTHAVDQSKDIAVSPRRLHTVSGTAGPFHVGASHNKCFFDPVKIIKGKIYDL
jgi:hypothetical protein